jgi:hypothetical protein
VTSSAVTLSSTARPSSIARIFEVLLAKPWQSGSAKTRFPTTLAAAVLVSDGCGGPYFVVAVQVAMMIVVTVVVVAVVNVAMVAVALIRVIVFVVVLVLRVIVHVVLVTLRVIVLVVLVVHIDLSADDDDAEQLDKFQPL